jgi:hypothetical protein
MSWRGEVDLHADLVRLSWSPAWLPGNHRECACRRTSRSCFGIDLCPTDIPEDRTGWPPLYRAILWAGLQCASRCLHVEQFSYRNGASCDCTKGSLARRSPSISPTVDLDVTVSDREGRPRTRSFISAGRPPPDRPRAVSTSEQMDK